MHDTSSPPPLSLSLSQRVRASKQNMLTNRACSLSNSISAPVLVNPGCVTLTWLQTNIKGGSGALSVTWPLDNMAYSNSTTRTHIIGKSSIANSLHHSVRVILAGKTCQTPNGRDRAPSSFGSSTDVYSIVRWPFSHASSAAALVAFTVHVFFVILYNIFGMRLFRL